MPIFAFWKRQRSIALLILVLATALGTGNGIAQTIHQIERGDTVRVTVFGEPDLSGDFIVDTQGRLNLALIGPVPVASLTPDQTRILIRDAYQDGYLRHPDVAVEIIAFRPIFIVGEVNQPGSYDYVPGMNVLNAIALGGGMTYRGKEDDIEILRGTEDNRISIPATLATPVMPGDTIRVAERYF